MIKQLEEAYQNNLYAVVRKIMLFLQLIPAYFDSLVEPFYCLYRMDIDNNKCNTMMF